MSSNVSLDSLVSFPLSADALSSSPDRSHFACAKFSLGNVRSTVERYGDSVESPRNFFKTFYKGITDSPNSLIDLEMNNCLLRLIRVTHAILSARHFFFSSSKRNSLQQQHPTSQPLERSVNDLKSIFSDLMYHPSNNQPRKSDAF